MALVGFGGETPNPTALAQQAALVSCLYMSDKSGAQSLLGGDGEILKWTFRPNSWPPSWAAIRSGADRYFVIVAGTSNTSQAIAQGGTWNGAEPFQGQGCEIGIFWNRAWLAMIDEVQAVVPFPNAPVRCYFSGHSLGGAVAQLAALHWCQRGDPGRVELLTIGGVKCLTAGYTGPQPRVNLGVSSLQDPIPAIPTSALGSIFVNAVLPASWIGSQLAWTAYTRPVPLAVDGSYATTPANTLTPERGVAIGPIQEHGMANYLGRARLAVIRAGSDPDGLHAVDVGFAALAGPVAQAEVQYVTPDVLNFPGDVTLGMLLALSDPRPAPFLPRGGKMALFKVSWIFTNAAEDTWTENYWWQGESAAAAAKPRADLIDARLAMLSVFHQLYQVRAVAVDDPNVSAVTNYGLKGTRAGLTGTDKPDLSGSTALFRMKTSNGKRRMLWLRGLSDADIALSAAGKPELAPDFPAKVAAFLVQLILDQYGMAYIPAVAGTGAYAWHYLKTADGLASPGFTVITTADAHGLAAGNYITLGSTNKKTVPGLKGIFKVLAVTDTSLTVRYTTPQNIIVARPEGKLRRWGPLAFSVFAPLQMAFVGFKSRKTKNFITRSRANRSAVKVRNLA